MFGPFLADDIFTGRNLCRVPLYQTSHCETLREERDTRIGRSSAPGRLTDKSQHNTHGAQHKTPVAR
jgi:hypothetical protein